MKITAIKTSVCHARMRNWIFVKVETDQSGLFGWGEATLEWHTRGVVGAIEDLTPLLIGEDPRRIEYLWQIMFRQHFWHGSGIVRSTAISGIDIALWDTSPESILRRAYLPSPVGRAGARLCAALLPSGRRQDGGILRNPCRQRGTFRRSGARGGGERLFRLQINGGAADPYLEGAWRRCGLRNRRWRRCAMR